MTLDPERFSSAGLYLSGDLRGRLIEAVGELMAARQNWVDARITERSEREQVLLAHWEDSVAAQNRAMDAETRLAWNVVQQCEADYWSLRDEVDLLRFLVENRP